MQIYHYASINDWRDIKEGSWLSGHEPGLGPSRRVCELTVEDPSSTEGAVFGLLEPEPDSWVNNTEFPLAWEYLMRDVGKLLLTYEPDDELVDRSFVIDWSHRERALRGHKDDLGKQFDKPVSREDRLLAERSYWASRVPLADYIENPEAITELILPEVITMSRVPASLIKVANVQPKLKNLVPATKDNLRRVIEDNPDLDVLGAYID